MERVHQGIGNIIQTFELESKYVDEDPWKGILSATVFAVRATFHTTLRNTPGQQFFGRDMIFNIKHEANWEFILEQTQLIEKSNNAENAKSIPHSCSIGDKVLNMRRGTENKYKLPYEGPYYQESL